MNRLTALATAPRTGPRLRTVILLLLALAAGYVVALSAVLTLHIGSATRALRAESEPVLRVYEELSARIARVNALVLQVHRGLAVDEPPAALGQRLRTTLAATAQQLPAEAYTALPDSMQAGLGRVDDQISRLQARLVELASRLELGRTDGLRQTLGEIDSLSFEIAQGLGRAQSIGLRDLAERERRLELAIGETTRVVGWWLVGGLLLVPIAAAFVRRRLDLPLADLEQGLARVAAGELNAEVAVRHADELGRLATHFNETTRILRQRAEEQGRFAAAGQLIADVAHEVNNPLMAIAALSDSRLEDPALSPEARDDWVHVHRQARRAGKLISSLLRFVRPTAPRLELVALGDVVRSAVDLVAYRFPVDEVRLEERLDPALPPAAADAARLEQVFVNLLTNAIDATRQVPPPRRLLVESWLAGGRAHVAVSDNGPGIPPAVAERLFRPFVTTKGAAGTGLGLYISRQIMREAGGELELAAAPAPGMGQGARFVVSLPAAVSAATVAASPAPAPAGGMRARRPTPVPGPAPATLAGLRVALVDDEAAVRRPVIRFLERRGAEVIEAANGREALSRIGAADVDVVIADLRMPVMDGAEFFRRLRATRPELAERVVFLSGDLRPIEDGALPVPPERMLVKPIDLREIERVVLVVAGRNGEGTMAPVHDRNGGGGYDE